MAIDFLKMLILPIPVFVTTRTRDCILIFDNHSVSRHKYQESRLILIINKLHNVNKLSFYH